MAQSDVARNLLFGLLAFQTRLIDRAALASAFRTWVADKSRTLAEILADQGALPLPRRALLEALVGEHIETHGGDPTKSLASLDDGKSTLETLAKVGGSDLDATLSLVRPESTVEGGTERTANFDVGSATAGNQRFRVLRPHARGSSGRSSWPSTPS